MIIKELALRKAIRSELSKLVLEARKNRLMEKQKEDVDFDPEAEGLGLPKKLVKLLDPDLSPQKFAALDSALDDSGSPQHQAIATAVFALNYADNDEGAATAILSKAKQLLPKLLKAQETPTDKE